VQRPSFIRPKGNLQEAARFLSGINEQTRSFITFGIKIMQLKLERNYGEAIRLLQARLAQFHFTSQFEKAGHQLDLAFMQRLSGDTAGAKITVEQARTTLEPLCRDQPDNSVLMAQLSRAYALLGEKDSALKEAESAIMLRSRAEDAVIRPALEENLAFVQTMFGETSRAISTLTQLLQTAYDRPITAALLRLDPIWDALRADPDFQKLCEEKKQ
jgi:tetratricopeptide (TPR) repeat protein